MNLENYMKNNKPNRRKSKLDAIRDEIETLYISDYSQKQILDYVNNHKKIEVSLTALQHFLKSRFDKNIVKSLEKKAEKNENTNKEIEEKREVNPQLMHELLNKEIEL